MINISEFTKCANCGACYNICPVDAIDVRGDDVFYSLKVNEEKCVSCGLCKDVCPVNLPQIKQNVISAYGGANRDAGVVKNSSSGGAFSSLAEYILSLGGVVYGACYDKDFKSVTIKSSDEVNISCMRKSKYVESRVGFAFRQIKNHLKSGRVVLFSGSPCQVAGLKRFLKKDYENLYTCDFICGGFASHNMYENYISGLEKKYKSSVNSVDFRSKALGWNSYCVKINFENKKKYESPLALDAYLYGFVMQRLSVRDYCYECEFCENHYSDIILADFWRYRELSSFEKNDKGLSMMLVNSPKGEVLVDKIRESFDIQKIDCTKAEKSLKKEEFTKEKLDLHKEFIEFYKENGIFKAAEKFYLPSCGEIRRIKRKSFLKKVLKGLR